jgi:hypothetical protein
LRIENCAESELGRRGGAPCLQDASAEWNVVAGEIIRFDSPQDDERPWHCNALHAVLVMAMASE